MTTTVDVLSATRMAPLLRRAVGAPASAPCQVVDAKWQGLQRVDVLYAVEGRLVSLHWNGAGPRLACFPDDPALPTLPTVMEPRVAADLVRRCSEDVLGAAPSRLRHCRVEVLRYRPGKRATLLLRPRWPARWSTSPVPDVVAKVYHDAGKAAAVTREAAALAAAVPDGGPLALAPVLGVEPTLSVVLQRRVAGQDLDDVLAGPQETAAVRVSQAARAMAVLHSLGAVTSRFRPVDRELDRFAARAATARAVNPRAAAQLEKLAQRLVDVGRELPAGTTGVVHGDCKPSQFLCGPHGVVVLDLDHCGIADPASDVGTFLASLRQRAERERTSQRRSACGRERLDALAARFRAAYLAEAPTVAPERIVWFEAVALERKALRALARAPHSALPMLLARAAVERLDELTGGSRCS